MRRILASCVFLGFGMAMAYAGDHANRHTAAITMNDNGSGDDCRDHLRVTDDDRPTVRDEEVRSIPNQPLDITAAHNGGIMVTTWDKPEIGLKLCKQVAADNESEGRKILAETRLEINGSGVSVRTPDEEGSLGTVLLVKTPKNANLKLTVRNGGVSLSGFNGTAEARAENGGISFQRSTGKLTAEAQNGGISIKDCGGEITAHVENGGLSITLPERWEGKGLDAQSRNGGLVVAVPKNYQGGLEVTASDHTSIICKDEVCDAGERTWDNGHKLFRLGGANPQVRARTENGGIVIKERGHSRGEI